MGWLPLFRSTASGSPDAMAWVWFNRFTPSRCLVPRTPTGLPCSQGTPCASALLSDPGRTSVPRHNGTPVLPPMPEQRGLQQLLGFRGSFTRLEHWLFTLRAAITDDDAKLASGWWLTFPGWDWIPTEFRWRVLDLSARPSPWASHGAIRVEPVVAHRLPHRPVRADFPHTVPPVTASPRRSNGRPARRETRMFPSETGSSAPTSWPSTPDCAAPTTCATASACRCEPVPDTARCR